MFFFHINKGFIKEGDVRLKLRCEFPLHFLPRRGKSPPAVALRCALPSLRAQTPPATPAPHPTRHAELDSASIYFLDYQNFFIKELYSFIKDATSFEE